MAFDFGATKVHSNRVDYGNIAALDAPAAYSVAFLIKPEIAAPSSSIFAKAKTTVTRDGWYAVIADSRNLQVIHANAEAVVVSGSSAVLTEDQWYSVVWTWAGIGANTGNWYIDGGAASNVSLDRSIGTTPNGVTIGSTASVADGAAIDVAHCMFWNVALTAQEARSWPHRIPRMDALKFWAPCHATAERTLVGQNTGTLTGTVGIVEHKGTIAFPGFSLNDNETVSPLFKVTTNSVNLNEAALNILGLLRSTNEQVSISEASLFLTGLFQVILDSQRLQDGGSKNQFDPAGFLTELMSDGTTWKWVNPPFTKRTKWS